MIQLKTLVALGRKGMLLVGPLYYFHSLPRGHKKDLIILQNKVRFQKMDP